MCHNLFPHFIPLFFLSLDVLPLFCFSLPLFCFSPSLLLSCYSFSSAPPPLSSSPAPLPLLSLFCSSLSPAPLIKVKKEGVKASSQWCKRRGIEEQRLYEMVKLRQQFRDVLLVSILEPISCFMYMYDVFLFYIVYVHVL